MERSGLSAETTPRESIAYDPSQVLRRVRTGRTFAERFDAFSDMYVWALAAVVALTYLTSALYGAIFVMIGQGVPHLVLPTAIWDVDALSVFLLPVVLASVFRCMLFTGPLGLAQEKADWWLPLPIARQVLLRPAWLKALGLGASSSVFLGLLWFLAFFGVGREFMPAVFGLGMVFFILMGLGLAAAAAGVQIRGRQVVARRISSAVAAGLAATAAALAAFGSLDNLASLLESAGLWQVLAALSAVFCCAGIVWVLRSIAGTPGAALREGGIRQQQLAGLLMQGDVRAVATMKPAPPAWRAFSARLTGRLPAAQRVLALRWLRSGLWKPAASVSAAALAAVLLVRDAANPLAACLLLAVLLGVLNSSLAEAVRPVTTQKELGELLGRTSFQIHRPALAFSAVVAGAALLLWCAGLGMLGFLEAAAWFNWLIGALLCAAALASSALAHAQRGERDWAQLFSNASTEMNMSAFLLQEFMTLIRALASGAVLYYVLLAPALPVPWGIWAIAALCAAPGVGKFFK